ncbi:ABC transporter ATP-binding protein [Alicyclobacillus sp. ALC3]|uniref:ABC transporter ATP-binding protein n=1 Tax=Alicyclobacillus sp. ALC3 TaxID=2796143 RepID=UPI002378508A|nr:ABC transporter ATP-binding protein [Alicyclobacillus sp. ALC3]WDL95940.1 ABC transporter ATP-binding protein [Alicyclobacillus sp. ALC3]
MGEPVLSVRGLEKQVRGRTLVKDVSFDVYRGQVFGFLGPNGAGKTTTIRMLVGLIRPSRGQVVINGHDLQKSPSAALRSVGCIVENPDLYPYLSGWENLYQLAVMQGRAAVERIERIADLVHLSDRLHDKVRTYSLGMRQRLGIAQALLCEPKLLILDEPTNGLDPAGIHELRSFLRDLAKDGMSVFISSHLLAEIELLCDSVAIIRGGTVIRTGSVDALITEASPMVVWRVEPSDTARAVLEKYATDGVVEPSDGGFHANMTDDAVAAAAAELAGQGCRLYEVTRRRATLEDVFLQATGGGTT